ncbi:hypothetical protein [Lactobacillus hominis]|uniref:Uncharacterized protein n=2 Tax=Lactobacillus hominis TaxID=1203033 RepID=I7KG97_9LACO|nr:hypothetical protein [Lactobacillus hominis]KRM85965.1 hypothetical protein FC41_GL000158 [Lactobacillus hominis DSM 23910 = CRBIP 24.179]CCI81080.1 Putative uncharacterized protein [Lactobacillus hominis DSM 23910 = CRBIP 24.179]
MVNKLKIDSKNQVIQGVKILDKILFQKVRFAVQNNHLEGWNPTQSEISQLVEKSQIKDSSLETDFNKIFGENNE